MSECMFKIRDAIDEKWTFDALVYVEIKRIK